MEDFFEQPGAPVPGPVSEPDSAPAEPVPAGAPAPACKYSEDALRALTQEVEGLKDLFVRRLMDDKQKSELIHTLSEEARFAFVEPFLAELILLLDRLERTEDETAASAGEELYSILNRRGIARIEVKNEFDPALYKAVRVKEDPSVSGLRVTHVIRNGYTMAGRVIRPAEVAVARPPKNSPAQGS